MLLLHQAGKISQKFGIKEDAIKKIIIPLMSAASASFYVNPVVLR